MSSKKEYTFLWHIENFSFCWHTPGKMMFSPVFTVDEPHPTDWCLCLYSGEDGTHKGCIGLELMRKPDSGPDKFNVRFNLAIVAEDGSTPFLKHCKAEFHQNTGHGWVFTGTGEITSKLRAEYLPLDILTVRCKLQIGEGNAEAVDTISARTRIGVGQVSFLHEVHGFSALQANSAKTRRIYSPTQKGWLESKMYISDDSDSGGRVVVEIAHQNNYNQILAKCELYLLNSTGYKMKCADEDNRFDADGKEVQKLHLSLTRDDLMSKKCEYLPQDKLSLLCVCGFSMGIEFQRIEGIQNSTTLEKVLAHNPRIRDATIFAKRLSYCPSALDELKIIYRDSFMTDVKLMTKSNSFPAHRVVLSARSPVFKNMLSHGMKEKNSGSIQVDDLEDETVKHLLHFLYSDDLEDLQWESATKLYYAADKYQIEKLKLICTTFLIDNLGTHTSIELLILADTHNDSDLKRYVENFIWDYDDIVFVSDEWQELIKSNLQLTLETMLSKYKTGKRR